MHQRRSFRRVRPMVRSCNWGIVRWAQKGLVTRLCCCRRFGSKKASWFSGRSSHPSFITRKKSVAVRFGSGEELVIFVTSFMALIMGREYGFFGSSEMSTGTVGFIHRFMKHFPKHFCLLRFLTPKYDSTKSKSSHLTAKDYFALPSPENSTF